jgi:hypothetical protein
MESLLLTPMMMAIFLDIIAKNVELSMSEGGFLILPLFCRELEVSGALHGS